MTPAVVTLDDTRGLARGDQDETIGATTLDHRVGGRYGDLEGRVDERDSIDVDPGRVPVGGVESMCPGHEIEWRSAGFDGEWFSPKQSIDATTEADGDRILVDDQQIVSARRRPGDVEPNGGGPDDLGDSHRESNRTSRSPIRGRGDLVLDDGHFESLAVDGFEFDATTLLDVDPLRRRDSVGDDHAHDPR